MKTILISEKNETKNGDKRQKKMVEQFKKLFDQCNPERRGALKKGKSWLYP